MAKKEEAPKPVLERTYNVPLRREFIKVPRWKKTKKAVKALREFLQKHMKSKNVKLGIHVNELLWKNGIKNPPHHVKVFVTKDAEGNVFAELEGIKVKAPKVKGVEKKIKEAEKPKVASSEKKEEAKEKKVEEKAETKVKPEPKDDEQEKVAELAKEIMQKGSVK